MRKKQIKPIVFDAQLIDAICERIANAETLENIAKTDGYPSRATMFRELKRNPEFAKAYAAAKQDAADAIVCDIQEMLEEKPMVTFEGKVDSGWVQHLNVKIQSKKWLAAVLKPHVYGPKVDVNHGGQADNQLTLLVKGISGTSLPIVPDDDEGL